MESALLATAGSLEGHCEVQQIVKEQIVEPHSKVVGTRARSGAAHVAMTPPQQDEANAAQEGPDKDGFSV